MSTKVQLSGGAFQDAAGNVLADGYLLMQLSQDGSVNGADQVAAGIVLKIYLDANGNVSSNPAQYVWPNDAISPSGTFYTVSAYTANGQLVWGPNSQVVFSTPSPYDVGAWVPAEVSTGTTQITTYDIGVFIPGQYSANQVLLLLPLERTVYFSANLDPSVAAAGVNPTAQTVLTINKNGTQFGTLTITATGTAAFAASAQSFGRGDVLTIVGPATPDTTLANIGITLSGNTVLPT